ncbi:MAG: Cof-type HAD-IIB family hydrolase [Spirochaetaceae bacterium]|jgi:Cof subfamily protein (haloacid dehalogenase superfamily)|nr:Cof-type HAD-IIB family hydrolase [Spirochaetaceae bacterium]
MEKHTNIKALASDMDGTLLMPDKTLGDRTLKALGACMEKGIKVILSTGRGVESVEPYRRTIGTSGPQIYYNGAEVLDMPGGTTIHAELLGAAPVLFCLELARKKGLYLQVYFPAGALPAGTFGASDKEILLTEKLGPESEYYLKNSGLQARAGDLEAALSTPGLPGIIKCMFITKEEYHEELKNSIRERFGDSVTLVRSSPIYLEILAKGVSKGAGLARALKYLDIDPKDTIVFGDEENDLSMFAAAGYSAAPANAAKAALEKATFRIGSNAGEGVAAFLEERVLGREPG